MRDKREPISPDSGPAGVIAADIASRISIILPGAASCPPENMRTTRRCDNSAQKW